MLKSRVSYEGAQHAGIGLRRMWLEGAPTGSLCGCALVVQAVGRRCPIVRHKCTGCKQMRQGGRRKWLLMGRKWVDSEAKRGALGYGRIGINKSSQLLSICQAFYPNQLLDLAHLVCFAKNYGIGAWFFSFLLRGGALCLIHWWLFSFFRVCTIHHIRWCHRIRFWGSFFGLKADQKHRCK
jgi:hypothetical protein